MSLARKLISLTILMCAAVSMRAGGNSNSTFRLAGAPASQKLLLLAIDEHAFPLRDNLALFITKPAIRAKPVMFPSTSPDAPDNVATHFYGTVLFENGRFRMWYYACHRTTPDGGLDASPVCYAESANGEDWTRPNLGQAEWHGNRNNNIILLENNPTIAVSGVTLIRDDDDPRPERRYKMVYYPHNPSRIVTAISPDGLHWTTLPGNVTGGRFAEHGSFYKQGGLYFVSAHIRGRGADDRPEGRQGYSWVSADFDHWLAEAAPSFKTPEPLVGSGYGTHSDANKGIGNYTQDHIGIGAASLGNVVVGIYGMWHQRQINWGEGGINCDLGLVVSQDGLHFDEVVKSQPYIRSDESPADVVPGKNYPTILTQGNGILNVGNETLIYHGRWRNVAFQQLRTAKDKRVNIARDYWGGVGLAKLPRDRWGGFGLSGEEKSGSLWTAPVTLAPGSRLTLNASGLDGLSVGVADERFQPLAGFEQGKTRGDKGDAFDAEVDWEGRRLQELAGKTVRFRIQFARSATTNPRLFALNLLQKP